MFRYIFKDLPTSDLCKNAKTSKNIYRFYILNIYRFYILNIYRLYILNIYRFYILNIYRLYILNIYRLYIFNGIKWFITIWTWLAQTFSPLLYYFMPDDFIFLVWGMP